MTFVSAAENDDLKLGGPSKGEDEEDKGENFQVLGTFQCQTAVFSSYLHGQGRSSAIPVVASLEASPHVSSGHVELSPRFLVHQRVVQTLSFHWLKLYE